MKKQKTLLEQAKEVNTGKRAKNRFSKEEYELALALFNGDVSMSQVCKVLKLKGSAYTYTFAFTALKSYLQTNNKRIE